MSKNSQISSFHLLSSNKLKIVTGNYIFSFIVRKAGLENRSMPLASDLHLLT